MSFSISDHMISEFLSGLIVVLILLAVGGVLALILGRMIKDFLFTRMALVLVLTPVCIMRFLDRDGIFMLYLYAMSVTLLGIAVDGIGHLLMSKQKSRSEEVGQEIEEETEQPAEIRPGMIVWDKAE